MRHLILLAVFVVHVHGFIKCRSNDKGSDDARVFSSDYCAVKRDPGGELIFTEGTKELCDKTTASDCFNPSPDVLCCKGDFCNANLKSTDCSTFNPPRCPTGNGLSPTELRNCPPGGKFCHFAVFTSDSKEIGFEARCAPLSVERICDKIRDGCMDIPMSEEYSKGDSPVGEFECCKPVEVGKDLAMDWGWVAKKEDLIDLVKQDQQFR